MAKMRVHELAKELNIKSQEIIDALSTTEYAVKSASSGLEDDAQKVVRSKFTKKDAAPKAAPKAAAGAGSVKVAASVPGKVLKIAATVGQAVKAGDNIVILESMKMEIPVVAPQDGTVASIDVAEGASVENGDTLATMN